MPNQVNKELMEELEKVPEGMRYIEAPNYSKIKKLLEESTPYIRTVRSSPALGAPYGQEPSIRSCNRHNDCNEANRKWLETHPLEKYVPINFHCHDDECEDCFGC